MPIKVSHICTQNIRYVCSLTATFEKKGMLKLLKLLFTDNAMWLKFLDLHRQNNLAEYQCETIIHTSSKLMVNLGDTLTECL